MKNHPLFPLASKLRPELKELSGSASLQAFSEVLSVLYLFPITLIGMIWLVLTDSSLPSSQDIFLLGLLAISLLITNSQTAMIYVNVGPKEKLGLSSSLGSVIFWAAILIWGPLAILANLIADTLTSIIGSLRMKRLKLNRTYAKRKD